MARVLGCDLIFVYSRSTRAEFDMTRDASPSTTSGAVRVINKAIRVLSPRGSGGCILIIGIMLLNKHSPGEGTILRALTQNVRLQASQAFAAF